MKRLRVAVDGADGFSTDGAPSRGMNRRTVISRCLLTGTGGLAALAGCSTDGPSDGGGETTSPPADGETPTAAATDETPASDTAKEQATPSPTADGDLDLREANVTGVTVEQVGGRTFEFSVTLYHDDDGEGGYANWWQAETRDGKRLGRRELLHAHGTHEFTRSEEMEIPERVDCVVVRGHDQTHEYGGQAGLVRLSTGETRFVDQGPEQSSLADEDCA